MKKILYIIGIFVIIAISVILIKKIPVKTNSYTKNLFYMDTYISVKVNSNLQKNKIDNILNGVEDIYTKYQKLTNTYDETSDIYYINNNDSTSLELTIDEDLYKLIELGLSWYDKSNGKFNINMGNIISIWKEYRDNENGIPALEELKNSGSINISDIVLLGDNKIKNTHPNIDLGAISKGYATKEVGEYLEENDIDDYVINAGGNVLVGKSSSKDYYSIGVENPEDQTSLYTTVNGNNIAVVTSGGYERFYEYGGIKYHHIIDPDTLYPANNALSVTVICEDSAIADILSTTLFLLSPEDAISLVDSLENTEAIIYVNSDTILRSKGYSKYE